MHAPERIRGALRESLIRRSQVSAALLAGRFGDAERTLWREGQREYRKLRAAMRADLGLDFERVGDDPAGPQAPAGVVG